MNIRRTNSRSVGFQVLWMLAILAVCSCSPDLTDDPIPPTAFPDMSMNLNLPQYIAMKSKGNSMEFNDLGVRGVILYCQDAGVYLAYERNCSFRPNDACATVNVDVSHLFMTDPCCASSFDFNTGYPTGGSAWRPLRQYRTRYNGFELTITDEVVE
ncbi:MAG: hypothetical protein WKF87_15220 [Chryseolinea sp.]